MLSSQSKTFNDPPCKIQCWHHSTCQIEQKAWLFVSSLATAHQVEDNEWNWTRNTVTVVCFVIQFMIIISSAVRPSSIWHIVTVPYLCVVCDIIFYHLPCWHRHKTGVSAKKQCLETMLARWKEWEKIKKKKECVREIFSCSCPWLFNFIWDYWAWWA